MRNRGIKVLPLKDRGLLIVISGPSGVGKGTVCSYLRLEHPELAFSISATTRPRRNSEVDGENYFFMSREEFMVRRENGDFLEWAEVYGNLYGTPRWAVEATLARGQDVVLEIDIQGALKVKEIFPEGVFIFLLPPSKDELEKRIKGRAQDSPDTIRYRLSCVDQELAVINEYQYAIVNGQVEEAASEIKAIISAEKCRISRYKELEYWKGGNTCD
ncbi:guanylate kinase [Dehalobacterium formicoaceticum]|uniref:guanylate kinase n=1 Tax=Dehalobacterium formicoaceticum TaxID=51515 RepID=UPI000B7DCD36